MNSSSSSRNVWIAALQAVQAFGAAYARVALGLAIAVIALTCASPLWA